MSSNAPPPRISLLSKLRVASTLSSKGAALITLTYIAYLFAHLLTLTCQVPLLRHLPLIAPLVRLLPTITYMLLHILPIQ